MTPFVTYYQDVSERTSVSAVCGTARRGVGAAEIASGTKSAMVEAVIVPVVFLGLCRARDGHI